MELNPKNKNILGHIAALITVIIWGGTFVSTKILLNDFSPVEILISRFVLGYITFWFLCPHSLGKTNPKREFLFAMCGMFGICFYYLAENIALTFTNASNVSVINSCSPFFTAVLALIFCKEKLSKYFYIGFLTAIIGISIMSFNSLNNVELNPAGDFLALTAACMWGCYSTLVKKISNYKYNPVAITRRIFFYGILFIIPFTLFFDCSFKPVEFLKPVNSLNILFLGLLASALCFLFWNLAVKFLGAVKTSVYIYLIPVITILLSNRILNEKLTVFIILGTALTIAGLIISKYKN